MNGFSLLADYYDDFSDESFYKSYLQFIVTAIERFSLVKVEDILDLACGTGLLSDMLHKKGYGMVCVDASTEMLSEARVRNPELLLINQNMTEFELYGTVQASICSLDSLNYLKTTKELEKTFSGVANYTENGGLFIFDINTKYRFEYVYGSNNFVFDNGDLMIIWQNSFKKNGTHVIDLTYFKASADNSFTRSDERQVQKYFSPKTIEKLLFSSGFELIGKFGTCDFTDPTDTDEKIYYIARRFKSI